MKVKRHLFDLSESDSRRFDFSILMIITKQQVKQSASKK